MTFGKILLINLLFTAILVPEIFGIGFGNDDQDDQNNQNNQNEDSNNGDNNNGTPDLDKKYACTSDNWGYIVGCPIKKIKKWLWKHTPQDRPDIPNLLDNNGDSNNNN